MNKTRASRLFHPLLWVPLGVILVVAAAFLWYPPLRQAAYAPVAETPFFEGASSLVNVNEASVAELTVLPGIGETRARAIVAYRQENGPFAALEDLGNVQGIGPAALEKMSTLVCFT